MKKYFFSVHAQVCVCLWDVVYLGHCVAFDPVFGWVRMGVGRCWWVFSLALDFINICKEKMSFEIIFLLLNVKC